MGAEQLTNPIAVCIPKAKQDKRTALQMYMVVTRLRGSERLNDEKDSQETLLPHQQPPRKIV